MASKKRKRKDFIDSGPTKKTKHLTYVSVGIAVIAVVYLLYFRETVVTKNVVWSCSGQGCYVRFTIENKTRNIIDHQYMIRAFRNRSMGHGAIVSDVVGEKSGDFSLYPGEKQTFEDRLTLIKPGRVELISVTNYESLEPRPRDRDAP